MSAASAFAQPRQLEIHSVPITAFDPRDPQRMQFGALEFRGGLVLSSPDKMFGELSGLRIAPDGEQFLSVTDKGWWLRGRIVARNGRPAAIENAEIAPILDGSGTPLADGKAFDTESLAEDDGTYYVGIERVNQIMRFDVRRDGLTARGERIALPPGIGALPFNQGLEALAFVPRASTPLGGTLIAISEKGLDDAGNIRGFLIGGPSPGPFSVKRTSDYDVTDAALLPGGDLLILERFFAPSRGVGMRIRRIALSSIRPGAVLDGRVLIEADLGYQIDNMEGLAVHRGPSGETVLTIVSDDNMSAIQRTLLLQFTLVE